MKYEVKELTVGGILDQAISIVKNRFSLLFGIAFVLYVPCSILLGLWATSIMPELPEGILTLEQAAAFEAKVLETLPVTISISLLVSLIVVPLTNAAVIHAIAKEYLQKPTSLGEAFSKSLSLILPLIGTGILVGLAVMGGMFLLIIPGIIFAFWFMLYMHVVVIEGVSGVAAMKRSKALMKGNVSKAFLLLLLVGVISWCVQLAGGMVGGYPGVVVQNLLAGVVMVFSSAAMVVFYFSCRCKNEAFDLTLLAASIGEADADGGEPSVVQS